MGLLNADIVALARRKGASAVAAVIANTRSGNCGKCGGEGTMQPADVATFVVNGRAGVYSAKTWEGWRCSSCANEAAIGR